MQINITQLHAEVYAENRDKKILYIKVSIPSMRMYINSCTVRPSAKYDNLWFQMPAFLTGPRWTKPIEFDGASEFQDLLKDEAMRAADQYIQDKKLKDIYPGDSQDGREKIDNVFF